MSPNPSKFVAFESFHFLPVEGWSGLLWSVPRAGHLKAGPDYRIQRRELNGHDLIYCLSGHGEITVDDRVSPVRPGEIAWLPGDRAHRHAADPQAPWTVLWLRVQGRDLEDVRHQIFGRATVVPIAQAADLPGWFDSLFETMRWRGPNSELKINALVADLFLRLAGHRADRQDASVPEALGRLMAAMSSQPARKWSQAEMCAVARVSASHLRRMFQDHLGTTPRGWLRNERIVLAQKLLLGSDARIGTVAERCGFSDVYHFSRDFKRAVGSSPSHWRDLESGEIIP